MSSRATDVPEAPPVLLRHPWVEAMSSRATDVPEAPPVLRWQRSSRPPRERNDITTQRDDEVWCG